MFKLIRFLRPFIVSLIIAVALLFVQAMCDLSLPDYMANIVNTGLQQSGMTSAVPEAIRQSEMDKVTLFLSEADQAEVLQSYDLYDATSPDYPKYLKKYPNLDGATVYVLKDIDQKTEDRIEPILQNGLLAVASINQKMLTGEGMTFNEVTYKSSEELFSLIGQMPVDQRVDMMTSEASAKAELLGNKMMKQFATMAVKAEYEAIGIDTDKMQSRYILNTGLLMLLISLLGAICTIAVGFIAARIAAGVARNLRRQIFTKVESFSNVEFDKFSTATLMTRSTNDITQIQMLMVIVVRMVFYAPIMAIGGILRANAKSGSMSWTIALAVIVLLGLIGSIFAIAFPKFKMIQKLIDRINLITRESLTGMMVIRAFNTQKFEEKRFDGANKDLTRNSLFINRVISILFPVMMLIMNGVNILIIWVGAHQIEKSTMQVGDMMAFMQYAMLILMSFLMLSMVFIMIPRASVAAVRISEVLETELSILDPKDPKHFEKAPKGLVEFKNVSFRYPGAEDDMLKDISFKAQPGMTTAIIGSTGSGKTTLINLIPRFYDVTGGQILVDGMDVRNLTQHELRSIIGYIPQKGSLFSGTIESNLKYADENASDQDIKAAAETAQAMEFIDEKPEGFASEISQGGTNVSGGQKQRISIARALVKKPQIFIFDDSFSALDFKTDRELRKALKEKTGASNLMIVAQRISTIKNAEQIIVLDEGKMVGIGTHKELMANNQTYQEIALSQLSKEELA